MVRLVLVLLLAGCRLYDPEVRDCAFRCGESGGCPQDTTCVQGYCRVAEFRGQCDCALGDQRLCGGSMGECHPGTQFCRANGLWGDCVGEGKPTAEVCDGKDNDCDGAADNNIMTAPRCPLTAGVCAMASQSCVGGQFKACTVASYGTDYQLVESTCDGLDNDCDGVVDATAEAVLADAVSGEWDLLGYPGGYALVTMSAVEVTVSRFDVNFTAQGTTRLARGSSPGFLARNDGAEVYVILNQGGGPQVTRFSLGGAMTTLPSAPTADVGDLWQAGLVPGQVLVLAYRSTLAGARSVEWPLSGGAPVVHRLDLTLGGETSTTLSGVYASRGGRYVAWKGATAAGVTSQLRTTQTDTPLGAIPAPGPQSAALVEGPQGQLISVYASASSSPPASGIFLSQNLVDGGAEIPVRASGEADGVGPVAAVSGPAGALLSWPEHGAVSFGAQRAIGNQSQLTIRSFDGGVTGVTHLAVNGSSMVAVAWERAGRVVVRRLCAP